MVIKLLPEQVAKLWHVIRFGIAESFVPRERASNEVLQRYLVTLLSGERQAWAILNQDKGIAGVLVTRISIEGVTGERALSLDHIYAFEVLPKESWEFGWTVLEKFAKKNSCNAVVALTENERILQMATEYKFKTISYIVREV